MGDSVLSPQRPDIIYLAAAVKIYHETLKCRPLSAFCNYSQDAAGEKEMRFSTGVPVEKRAEDT